jgi:TATA-binding protein-associated factor
MQSFMNIVEEDVLKFFGIKYLTLSGSMSSKERVETVDTFNSNTSYKILLLTTSVGGLGLTLTGADVVIFMEHDWNPMKDLQAMDRAHRIG